MRIGHFIPQYDTQTGSGIAVTSLCEALAKNEGVEVIAFKSGKENKEYYSNNVHIVPYIELHNKLINIPFHILKRLRDNYDRLDLVQLHAPFTLNNLILSKVLSMPYVYTPHGCLDPRTLNREGKKVKKYIYSAIFEKALVKNAVAVMAATNEEMQDVTNYVRHNHIGIIPFPISVNSICQISNNSFRKKYNFSNDDFIVIFIGRWDIYTKGLDILVKASKIVSMTIKNLRCVFIGFNHDATESLESLIEQENAEKICFPIGRLYGSDKIDAILDSDIYCQPSRYESFGLSIIEALSLGCPCLISKGCKISKILSDAYAAITFEPNHDELAALITKLYPDKQTRLQLSINAKSWVASELDPVKISKRAVSFYERAIKCAESRKYGVDFDD